jgi:SpoVK/Ycf46/Vps4 family AAA+-type ATPase
MRPQDKLKQALQTAEGLYYRLVLLVGEAGTGKTQLLRTFAKELDTEVLNINLALAAELLELSTKQRALALPELLAQVVEKTKPLLLLDNIEILFDKHLQQDALKLLQGLSRNSAVVASWNGRLLTDKLIYAEAGHPEYRSYELNDLLIVDLNTA